MPISFLPATEGSMRSNDRFATPVKVTDTGATTAMETQVVIIDAHANRKLYYPQYAVGEGSLEKLFDFCNVGRPDVTKTDSENLNALGSFSSNTHGFVMCWGAARLFHQGLRCDAELIFRRHIKQALMPGAAGGEKILHPTYSDALLAITGALLSAGLETCRKTMGRFSINTCIKLPSHFIGDREKMKSLVDLVVSELDSGVKKLKQDDVQKLIDKADRHVEALRTEMQTVRQRWDALLNIPEFQPFLSLVNILAAQPVDVIDKIRDMVVLPAGARWPTPESLAAPPPPSTPPRAVAVTRPNPRIVETIIMDDVDEPAQPDTPPRASQLENKEQREEDEDASEGEGDEENSKSAEESPARGKRQRSNKESVKDSSAAKKSRQAATAVESLSLAQQLGEGLKGRRVPIDGLPDSWIVYDAISTDTETAINDDIENQGGDWIQFIGARQKTPLSRLKKMQCIPPAPGWVVWYWYPDFKPQSWRAFTQIMLFICTLLRALCEQSINSCVLNKYRDQDDAITSHQDKCGDMDWNSSIVTLSTGEATRKVIFTNITTGRQIPLDLPPRSVYSIGWETNRLWKHEIPASQVPTGVRYGLTFRSISSMFHKEKRLWIQRPQDKDRSEWDVLRPRDEQDRDDLLESYEVVQHITPSVGDAVSEDDIKQISEEAQSSYSGSRVRVTYPKRK